VQQTAAAQGPTSHTLMPPSSSTNYIDPMGRSVQVSTLDNREWYIKPHDAKLAELSVQSDTDHQNDLVNWKWVPLKNKTPLATRLNMFVWESMPDMIGSLRKKDDEDLDAIATEPRQNEPAEQVLRRVSNEPNDLLKLRFPRNPKLQLCTRWAFATIVILPIVSLCTVKNWLAVLFGLSDWTQLLDPRSIEGRLDNNGYYDPVRYRDWGYTRSARNPQENDGDEAARSTRPQFDSTNDDSLEGKEEEILGTSKDVEKYKEGQFNLQQDKSARGDHYDDRFYDLPSRHLRPRLLCFRSDYIPDPHRPGRELKDGAADGTCAGPSTAGPSTTNQSNAGQQVYRVRSPGEWIKEYGQDASTEYVFVSYSREQFIVDTDEQIDGL
jgi:hypothetical protein